MTSAGDVTASEVDGSRLMMMRYSSEMTQR